MAYTTAQLNSTMTSIATLEASRKSNLATYIGSKRRNGGPWSGAGIQEAQRIAANLAGNPPSNLGSQADEDLWRRCVARVTEITGG